MNTKIIKRIVKASGVSAGEMVLVHFWGEDHDKAIANRFMAAVAAQGATPFLIQQSRTLNHEIFASASESCFDERYFEKLSDFDAVLDVFAYQPIVLGYPLEDEQFALYRKYVATLFYKLMECKRFTQIRIPTEANAAESGLEPQDYIKRMTLAYDVDYERIKARCEIAVEQYRDASRVAVHTGKDHVLSMELTGRAWYIDAGDGDLPCGEIYIAPLEEKTQGSVFFDTIFIDERKYDNIVLQVSDGMISGSNVQEVTDFFAKQSLENRVVCELGIGMNPNVTSLCGYTVLDEKVAGTFHIAIGANNMFGGNNKSSCHMDFVGQGRIEVLE